MPFAEFQNGNAGLAGPEYQQSLMDRVQRRAINAQDAEMKKQAFAAEMATNSLREEGLRAELGMRRIQFAETERTARELSTIRDEFAQVSPRISQSLAAIESEIDPANQRRLLAQLTSQAAKFARDPHLAPVLDKQFAATRQIIEANEGSKVAEAISTNQFAVDEMTAAQKFPGQGMKVVTRPGPAGTPVNIYIPTGRPDPNKEATALHILSLAQDEAGLQEAMADPDVAMMARTPGSKVPGLYLAQRETFQKRADALEIAGVKRSKDADAAKRSAADQDMQEKKFAQSQNALTVDGYEGEAKTDVEAKDFRKEKVEIDGVLEGIDAVEELGKKSADMSWLSDPIEKRRMQKLADQKVGMVVGALRIPITGPGAMTNEERKFIEGLVGNPTKIFSLTTLENSMLASMRDKFNSHNDRRAAAIGLGKRTRAPGGQSSAPAVSRADAAAAAAELARRRAAPQTR